MTKHFALAALALLCACTPIINEPRRPPVAVGLHDAGRSIIKADVSSGDTVAVCIRGDC